SRVRMALCFSVQNHCFNLVCRRMRVMKYRLLILMLVVASVPTVAVYAHHSFAGSYIEGETVKLEGTVAEFNIRNPHSFISIEVTDKDGKVSRWGGEWGGVTQLSQGGINRFTLK